MWHGQASLIPMNRVRQVVEYFMRGGDYPTRMLDIFQVPKLNKQNSVLSGAVRLGHIKYSTKGQISVSRTVDYQRHTPRGTGLASMVVPKLW